MFRRRVLVVGLLLIAAASAAWAQRFRVMEGPGMPLHMPPPHFSDGAFTICKMMYTSNRREANGFGWSTDYPYAGLNLMIRSGELTKTRISKDAQGEAKYWTVHLSDDALFECPFLVGSDVGTIGLSPLETTRLREYLLKGGFLWVDDFWGTRAWEQWSDAMRQVLLGPAARGWLPIRVEVAVLAVLAGIFLVLARAALRYLERLSKREGRLTQRWQ